MRQESGGHQQKTMRLGMQHITTMGPVQQILVSPAMGHGLSRCPEASEVDQIISPVRWLKVLVGLLQPCVSLQSRRDVVPGVAVERRTAVVLTSKGNGICEKRTKAFASNK